MSPRRKIETASCCSSTRALGVRDFWGKPVPGNRGIGINVYTLRVLCELLPTTQNYFFLPRTRLPWYNWPCHPACALCGAGRRPSDGTACRSRARVSLFRPCEKNPRRRPAAIVHGGVALEKNAREMVVAATATTTTTMASRWKWPGRHGGGRRRTALSAHRRCRRPAVESAVAVLSQCRFCVRVRRSHNIRRTHTAVVGCTASTIIITIINRNNIYCTAVVTTRLAV